MGHGTGIFSIIFDMLLVLGALGMTAFCVIFGIMHPLAALIVGIPLILIVLYGIALWKKV